MATPMVNNDTSVKIPRAITAAAARADEIHKAAYPTSDPPPATPPEGTPPANPPEPPPANTTPPPPAPVVPPPTNEDWQGRYHSLKGRFDQTQGQLQNQAARISSLEAMIATMGQPPAHTAPTPPKPASKRVKPEEVEEYGADFVDVVQRAALDIVQPLLDDALGKVRTEVKTEIGKVGGKVQLAEREAAVSSHQRLLDALDKGLTNWRVINKHPKFLNWLNLTEPLSGAIRKNLLNDAVAQGNATRALSFYRQFLAEEGDPAPAVPPENTPPASTPPNGNGAGNGSGNGLERYAAPGRPAASGSATPPATPDKGEIITRAQISAFYARKAKGHYTTEQAADLEAQIFAADREGRIR